MSQKITVGQIDSLTATAAEINILDGVTSTAAEINLLDGSTAGTVVNSKAVIYGASGEVNATTLQVGGVSITSTPAELNILDGVTATTAELNILDGVTATAAEINILDGVTATTAELNYTDGVTSNIQTQLNAKQATITGAATTIDDTNLTASRALVSDGSGKVAVSAVTSTELGYLDGVTSNIQTQLNGKQASGSYLTGNQTITLSGDASGSGTTSIVVTVANDSHTHAFNNLTSKTSGTGDYKTTGDFITAGGTSSAVKVGDGSGSMSLTTNDGYGNANVCFNHVNGVPDVSGNSGRIECNVDSGSGASMAFELKSGTTSGVAVQTSSVMTLTESAITANGSVIFSGTATSARYADLAERYTSDAEYEPGTVLMFGGEQEVTECTQRLDRRIAGIVSTDPAYLMNSELEGITVALVGRVPCKVVGEVRKGDLMVSSDTPGYAEAWREESNPPMGSVIGKALENKTGAVADVIEVVVGRL